jgi:hypothetical protein
MGKVDNRGIHLSSKPNFQKLRPLGAILLLLACTFLAPVEAAPQEPQRWSSFLPIWGDEARKRGYELPLPFGISANFYSERQDFEVQDLEIAFGNGEFISIGDFIKLQDIDTRQSNYSVRLDAWLLPFFNVYGLVGFTEGNMEGEVFVPGRPPILPALTIPLDIDYEGPTYGGGVTLAGGFSLPQRQSLTVFGVADGNLTQTDLDFLDDNLESGSEINAFVFSSRLGVRERISESLKGALWVGAMYQKVAQDFEGRVKSLDISFKIEQEPQHPWNALVGGRLEAGQHFDFIVEGGFGGRKSILGTISYRF